MGFRLLHKRQGNLNKIRTEKAAQLVAPHGVVGTAQNMAVVLDIVNDKGDGVVQIYQQIELFNNLNGFLLQGSI